MEMARLDCPLSFQEPKTACRLTVDTTRCYHRFLKNYFILGWARLGQSHLSPAHDPNLYIILLEIYTIIWIIVGLVDVGSSIPFFSLLFPPFPCFSKVNRRFKNSQFWLKVDSGYWLRPSLLAEKRIGKPISLTWNWDIHMENTISKLPLIFKISHIFFFCIKKLPATTMLLTHGV